MKTNIEGEWKLVGHLNVCDEIEYSEGDDSPYDDEIERWLKGDSDAELQNAKPAKGLLMKVEGNRFSETNTEFAEIIYDVEGIQVNDYQPMKGALEFESDIAILKPEATPEWAKSGGDFVRYDDGDTKIAEHLRVQDGKLIRSQSVVTDEIYLERIVLIYE